MINFGAFYWDVIKHMWSKLKAWWCTFDRHEWWYGRCARCHDVIRRDGLWRYRTPQWCDKCGDEVSVQEDAARAVAEKAAEEYRLRRLAELTATRVVEILREDFY